MVKANTIMTTRIDADNAIEIFSSVPTLFSSSGVYWATGVLADDDFTGEVCDLPVIGALAVVTGAALVTAGFCAVTLCLLAEYRSFLRFDLPGISALFYQLFSPRMCFFITAADVFGSKMGIHLRRRNIRMT